MPEPLSNELHEIISKAEAIERRLKGVEELTKSLIAEIRRLDFRIDDMKRKK